MGFSDESIVDPYRDQIFLNRAVESIQALLHYGEQSFGRPKDKHYAQYENKYGNEDNQR